MNTFIIGNALDVVQELKMKAFKVTGLIAKPELKTPFVRELIADKDAHAVEKVYAEIGSRHRVKRFQIKITSVQEVTAEEVENPILKRLLGGE